MTEERKPGVSCGIITRNGRGRYSPREKCPKKDASDRPALTRRGEDAAWLRRKVYARWSMLDVFGLALAMFLVEGDYLMKTEVRWGAALLVASLALKQAFDRALDRAAARARSS